MSEKLLAIGMIFVVVLGTLLFMASGAGIGYLIAWYIFVMIIYFLFREWIREIEEETTDRRREDE
jgi:hypothetical protein